MKCPFCANEDTKVSDSRSVDDNKVIRRRRACENCGERFTTYERFEQIELIVIKRDGTSEIFDPVKLKNGIMKSCNKRPVKISDIENIVKEIESKNLNAMKKEITSDEIGEFVMQRLKAIDEVSYIRFASVYRQFTDISNFKKVLDVLEKEKQ